MLQYTKENTKGKEMKYIHNITTLLLAMTLALLLSACNTKTSQDDNNTTGTSNPTTQTGDSGDTGGIINTTQEDTVPPVITLNGEPSITLDQDTPYEELGATAVDDVDGNVPVQIEGSVDSNTTGTYVLTYRAKDKTGNEASVRREVKVVSKYKILITRQRGNTASEGSWAYFDISLSHKPTHPVEIYIESDNPHEGVVSKELYGDEDRRWDKKTGRIVIQPKDWKRGETIGIKGTNKNVINGKQDYYIVTSPAVSDDPHFDGVDAKDVHMVGAILKIGVPDEPQVFFSGIEKVLNLWLDENSEYEPYDYPKITLVDKPEGMVEHEYKGFVWKPTKEDEGKTFHIKAKVNDNTKYRRSPSPLHDEVDFDVRVAKEKVLKTIVKENEVTIIDESSSLKGISLVFDANQNIADKIRVVKIDAVDVPKGGYFTHIGDTFRIEGAEGHSQTIKIKIPISSLPKNIDLNTIGLHTWESTDETDFKLEKNGVIPDDMWYGMYPDKIYRDLLDWGNIIFEFNYIYTGRLIVIGGEKKKSQVIKTANYKSYKKQNEVPC